MKINNISALFAVALVSCSNDASTKQSEPKVTLEEKSVGEKARLSGNFSTEFEEGVVDCRAGGHGSTKKNVGQTVSAVMTAKKDKFLDPGTLGIVGKWNASDSPGLAYEPKWIIDRKPSGSYRPYEIVINPDRSTCEGKDEHTQGVTFYKWRVYYY